MREVRKTRDDMENETFRYFSVDASKKGRKRRKRGLTASQFPPIYDAFAYLLVHYIDLEQSKRVLN